VTPDDLEEAKRAEARGQAAGMSALAERCAYVLEIGPVEGNVAEQPPEDSAALALAGVTASVVLGPILPPDHSTLFGVRGAMERLRVIS
jgi:hypothetical protein